MFAISKPLKIEGKSKFLAKTLSKTNLFQSKTLKTLSKIDTLRRKTLKTLRKTNI